MPARSNTEVRAALRNEKRVIVAISGGSGTSGIKLLIDAIPGGSAQNAHQAKQDPGESIPSPKSHLTPRELQILRLIARGLHNRQIASQIHRSIKTVEKHRQNLHVKLSTHEVAGLTRQALAMGLLGNNGRLTRLDKKAKHLTARELEVLKLVAEGSGNKWIASELRRSIKTVDHHRENIMKKLNIHEVAGLTSYAVSLGLI